MGITRDSSPNLRSWILLILLSLIWGSSFILMKKGLVVLSSGEVGALRIIFASLVLSPIAIRNLPRISRDNWKLLFVIGLVGTFFPAFLFAIAQTKLESSITGVLNALTPLWVLIMGSLFFSQLITLKKAMGVALGFIGSAILILTGSDSSFGSINSYAFFVILATALYGINLNTIKQYLGHLKAKVITSVSILFVSPLALTYLLTTTDFIPKMGQIEGFWLATFYIAVLGTVGTALALIMFNHLVQITNPIFTSSVTYLIPIVAIGWGIIDGEHLYLMHYLGIAVILSGIYLVNRSN